MGSRQKGEGDLITGDGRRPTQKEIISVHSPTYLNVLPHSEAIYRENVISSHSTICPERNVAPIYKFGGKTTKNKIKALSEELVMMNAAYMWLKIRMDTFSFNLAVWYF